MQIQKLTQELAFAKSEMARLERTGQTAQDEKAELQHAAETSLKEKELALSNEARKRGQLEAQVKDLQRELQGTNAQLEKLARSREEETRSMAEQHQETYTAARQESLLLEQKLEDALKELEGSKRENDELFRSLEKAKHEGRTLEEEFKHLAEENTKLKETGKKLEEDLASFKSVNFECSLRLKQMDEEKKRADEQSKRAEKEKDELVEKFNGYGEQLQKSNAEALETLMAKQKTKRGKLQKKIVELKGVIGKLEDDLSQHKKMLADVKASYEGTITGLHEDMKRVKEEWEHKVYEQDLECQRKVAEEQSKHALQISQLQEEYQQMLDSKLAEIQADAQSQINKTKSNHIEMKTLFESKMQSIEKAYVPAAKHEETLEEERRRAKEELDRQLAAAREGYEKELSARLLAADGAKAREVEQLSQDYKQNIATLEEGLAKAKKTAEEMEDRAEKIGEEKEAAEEAYQQLEKEKKRLAEQVEVLGDRNEELEKENESAKSGKRETESAIKASKENAAVLLEKFEKANAAALKAGGECEALRQKLSEITEERNTEARKTKGLQSEKEALQDSVRRLEEDKRQLSSKLQQQIEEFTNESHNLHSTRMQMRQKESDKLEKEIRDHVATKNELAQAESKVRQQEEELSQLTAKLDETEKQVGQLEEELNTAKGQAYELETKNQLFEQELHSVGQQCRRLGETHSGMKSNIQKTVLDYVFGLKEAVQLLKGKLVGSIATVQKDLIQRLERAVLIQRKLEVTREKEMTASLQKEKEAIKAELQKTIESKESEYMEESLHVNNKYEVMIKEKNAEIKQFQGLCEELENKNKALFKELADLQGKVKLYQTERERAEQDNDRLRREAKATNDKLVSFRAEVKDQTTRLRVDAETAASVARQELDGKYKTQLAILQKEVEALKLDSGKELRGVLTDLASLRLQHQYETEQMIQGYEHGLGQADYTLKIEKEKAERIRQDNERLQQELESSKEEYKSELFQMETKMKQLNQSLMTDAEKYKKLRADRSDEVDRLNKKARELAAELSLKTEVIEELTKEKENQRAQLKELKLNVELQETQHDQKDTEYAKVLSKKEKEIDELHKLLSKSYNSANSSLDKVRMASRLDNDVRELAKKVKEASGIKLHKEHRAAVRGSVDTSKSSDENRNVRSPLTVSQLGGSPPNVELPMPPRAKYP